MSIPYKFQIGDRVVCSHPDKNNTPSKYEGHVGTIIDFYPSKINGKAVVGVDYDERFYGSLHDLNGILNGRYTGWWHYEYELERLEELAVIEVDDLL